MLRSALVLLLIASCGGKSKPAAEPAPPPPAPPPNALENRLDDDTPLPPPEEVPPPGGRIASTGSIECDEFLRAFEELMVRCQPQLGPATDAMRQAIDAQRASFDAFKTLPPDEYTAAVEASRVGCQAGVDALRQTSDALGCGPTP